MPAPSKILVITAVAAERDAVLAGRQPAVGTVGGLQVHRALTPAGLLDVVCGGVGPVAAAVSTAPVTAPARRLSSPARKGSTG